ncbi:hypothetical protein MO867_17530 [Microbulbifer sp. OS29]|uniref:Uncharacterized protein n=1 Tax=Microbulbifer okhotskensis TaxID=2926617 RepID=A0A9X2J911_9GAMM|nr:hypothetical protein [Microbulbifer okhotskensis]MCO1336136.1 hypothetical protein [Microbulbifer okhotskensis]
MKILKIGPILSKHNGRITQKIHGFSIQINNIYRPALATNSSVATLILQGPAEIGEKITAGKNTKITFAFLANSDTSFPPL